MMLIDSPAISDGLQTWKKHLKDLDNLPFNMQNDKSLIIARERAVKIISIMESYAPELDGEMPLSALQELESVMINKEIPLSEKGKKVFSLSQLKETPPRTADDIRRSIAQGRFAEMTLDQAGE